MGGKSFDEERQIRYENAVERIRGLYDQIIRFGFLANAGGAVAALSFMGASWATSGLIKWGLLPLSFFTIGLILTAYSLNSVLSTSLRVALENRNPDQQYGLIGGSDEKPPTWFFFFLRVSSMVSTYSIPGSTIAFVLGSLSGIIVLAVS